MGSARLYGMSNGGPERRARRSWLDGPQIPSQFDEGAESRWAGEKLGLPKSGPGSVASVTRRAGAVAIDWIICWILAGFLNAYTGTLVGTATLSYLFFIVLKFVSVLLFSRSPGQALLGMGVARIDVEATVGLWRSAVRALGTALFFPAAMVDADSRGVHDRITGTVVIRG